MLPVRTAILLASALLAAGIYANVVDRQTLAVRLGVAVLAPAPPGFRHDKGIPFVWESKADHPVRTYRDPPGDPFEVRRGQALLGDIGLFLFGALAIAGLGTRVSRGRPT